MNTEDFKKELGTAMKSAREFVGMSRVQFSKKTGIKSTTLDHWESGNTTPNLHQAFLFADAVGLTVEDLVEAAGAVYTPLRKEAM